MPRLKLRLKRRAGFRDYCAEFAPNFRRRSIPGKIINIELKGDNTAGPPFLAGHQRGWAVAAGVKSAKS